MKWNEILISIEEKDNSNNLAAFASGIVSSFLTPSLSGNFLGRMFYYEKSKRWKITSYSLIANFAQFLISILIGTAALRFIPNIFDIEYWFINFIWIITLSLLIFFFFGEKILKNVSITKLQSVLIQIEKGPSRLKLLIISLFRYLVFVAQFALALNAFGETIDFIRLGLIAVIFLLITITPSLFFGKVIVRESISISVFSYAGMAILPVAFASFTTWVFNLLFPALIALIFVKNKK